MYRKSALKKMSFWRFSYFPSTGHIRPPEPSHLFTTLGLGGYIRKSNANKSNQFRSSNQYQSNKSLNEPCLFQRYDLHIVC